MVNGGGKLRKKFAGRPALSRWRGKRVLIMGLGQQGGGAGAAEFFAGVDSKIIVTDLKTKRELGGVLNKLKKYPIKFVLGRHRKEDIKWADYIIKNPGVPLTNEYLKFAKKLKKPILNDAAIFFDIVGREKIIGLTGTKGKSTAARLLAEFLENKYRVALTGLPGTSPLKDIEKALKSDWVIFELSSFDLDILKVSPQLAVITNIFPDHLNRYHSFRSYVRAKKNIFKFQKKGDILFLNKDDKVLTKLVKQAPGKVIFFKNRGPASILSPTSLNAALAVARHLGISSKDIKKTLKKFKPLEGRLEFLGKIKGITFINNTTATNPGSALFSLKILRKSHFRRIYLILGGENKGFKPKDYGQLVDFLGKYSKKFKVALLVGSATELMKKCRNWRKINVIIETDKMAKAVRALFNAAKKDSGSRPAAKGNLLLLSPAAASFNLFTDEFARGRAFKKSFREIKFKKSK